MAQLHKKKLTFDTRKYDGFENYSLFLKHVKETLRSKKESKDESSFCNFQELLDHLENSDQIDVFIFKVASVLIFVKVDISNAIFRWLLLERLGWIWRVKQEGLSRLRTPSSACSTKPVPATLLMQISRVKRSVAKEVQVIWIPWLPAMQ